jgi:uncharacterized protein with HEPN domain
MTKHDEAFYLEGIKEHSAAIKNYLPKTKAAFLKDEKTQDAVLMRLLALGEEISHLSDDFQEKHPELDWFKIVGLRNRIAHGYFEIDAEVVWETVTGNSLDELTKSLD